MVLFLLVVCANTLQNYMLIRVLDAFGCVQLFEFHPNYILYLPDCAYVSLVRASLCVSYLSGESRV